MICEKYDNHIKSNVNKTTDNITNNFIFIYKIENIIILNLIVFNKMGGNALKVNCIRINKDLYLKIKLDCISKLKDFINIHQIYELADKLDFGDLDLLYLSDPNINILNIVQNIFNPIDYNINGDVLSFSYEINKDQYFQIDLIKTSNINISIFYFSYGDIGNILGRIVKKYELTLGIDGLWITYENERIMLSEDPKEICIFLGLDYNVWLNGFNKREEFFDWIIKSKYFDSDFFKLDNLNNTYKHRYITRPTFKDFVNYVKDLNIKSSEIKLKIEDYILMFNKIKEKEKIDHKIKILRLYQTKFSGSIFLNFVDPKEINKYKDAFKKYISEKEDFNNWLIINNQEFINQSIQNFILNNKL